MIRKPSSWLARRPASPPAQPAAPRRAGRISLLGQILLATLVAGLLPLALISYSALTGYTAASQKATDSAVQLLDDQALQELQTRATQTADTIARFLEARVDDTRSLTLIPPTPEAFLAFNRMHGREIRYPVGSAEAPQEQRQRIPMYRELAYLDAGGHELLRIVDGQLVPADQLRDVSLAANTTYQTEDYVAQIRALPPGEVYVSPVMAWHTASAQQPAGLPAGAAADDSLRYRQYQGVVRFGAGVYTGAGELAGMVLLSLDHRHLMEYTTHIQPVAADAWTLYPAYASGNYAFMFDQDGYTIAHPLLSRIRGLDDSGRLVGYMRQDMTAAELARHPFNLRYAAWSDPNWPTIFAAVAQGQPGFAITINRAGARKASAYAPIRFGHGAYRSSGIFGGVVIGANVDEFHKSATVIRTTIQGEQSRQRANMLWILIGGIALLVGAAVLISASILRPVRHLTSAARAMEQGEFDVSALDRLLSRRIQDEVTQLTQVFKRMAEQVSLRERNLRQQIVDLSIRIDEKKKQEHVAEITESSYFLDLQQRVATMRAKYRDQDISE